MEQSHAMLSPRMRSQPLCSMPAASDCERAGASSARTHPDDDRIPLEHGAPQLPAYCRLIASDLLSSLLQSVISRHKMHPMREACSL